MHIGHIQYLHEDVSQPLQEENISAHEQQSVMEILESTRDAVLNR